MLVANIWSGAIERGATEGQTTYANDLVRVLKAGLSPRGRSVTQGKSRKKLRKRKSDTESFNQTGKKTPDWGPLQPIHDTFTRVSRWTGFLFASHSIIGVLLLLLVFSWFGNSRFGNSPSMFSGFHSKIPQSSRLASWEDMWLNEEEALWEWLEDRAGLADGLAFPPRLLHTAPGKNKPTSSPGLGRLPKQTLNKGDLGWAIKLTEQRLASMKQKLGNIPNRKSKTEQTASSSHGEAVEITDEEAVDLENLLNGVVAS